MSEETPKPNPVDLAREQVTKAIGAENFNGAKVLLGLDQLQNALLIDGTPPLNMFTELTAHAASARDRMTSANDMLQSQMFAMKADNYLRTAELLTSQEQPAARELTPSVEESIVPPTRTPRAPRVPRAAATRTSQPTSTASLPATNSSKR